MPRSLTALLSESFPRRLPSAWRFGWRLTLAYWMDWLLTALLFVLPWFAISTWYDSVELPRALLVVGAICIWLVLRGAYSIFGDLPQENGTATVRYWSPFSLWIGALGLAFSAAWLAAGHLAFGFLGNGPQISSSLLVLIAALWLVVAIRDAVQRTTFIGRRFLRAWVLGMGVAVVGALLVQNRGVNALPAMALVDLLLFIPCLFVVGLYLLATRGVVVPPLSFKKLAYYRLSHAFLALTLVGLLGLGFVVQLDARWVIILGGSVAALVLSFFKQRRLTLASFLSILGILSALFGLLQLSGASPLSTEQISLQKAFKLEALTELLPNQRLSWQLAGQTLSTSPIFGSGPGSWVYAFDQGRPMTLNQTPFWSARFPHAASFMASFVTEYGALPSLVVVLFCLFLIGRAVQIVVRTRDLHVAWMLLLFVSGLAYAALRPMGVLPLLSGALFTGLLAAQVFKGSTKAIAILSRPSFTRLMVTISVILVIGATIFVFQRAVSAAILETTQPYALGLARRLNAADDFTYNQEAQFSLGQAQRAAERSDGAQLIRQLDLADQAIGSAMTRNPRDAEHVLLALQIARLRSDIDQKAEDRALALAATLDQLRPTDPAAPLVVFAIQRSRASREQRWVEQGQGREKEEALARQLEANQAAEKALQESLRRKADYLPALYAQAAWLAERGNTAQAIASLETLAQTNQATPNILLPLALLYRQTNEPLKAVGVLQALIENEPANLEYQWQLSLALVQAKNWDDATRVLQRLVSEAPQETVYQTQLQEVLHRRAALMAPVLQSTSTVVTPTSTKPVTKKPVRAKR